MESKRVFRGSHVFIQDIVIPPLTPLPAARHSDHGMMVDQWEQWQEARGNYFIGVQVCKIVRCNDVICL